VGYVPPDKEQEWRNDAKNSDPNVTDRTEYDELRATAVTTQNLRTEDIQRYASNRDLFTAGKQTASQKLTQNEEKYSKGEISEADYLKNKQIYETDYDNNSRAEAIQIQNINNATERSVEANRALGMSNAARDDYAPRTEESQPLQDLGNPAGDGWGYNSNPETATVAESVQIDTGADRNINSYEQPIDASTQDNINTATDDYGNPLGSTPDTGASTTYNDVPLANVSGATDDYGNPLGNTPDTGASTRYDSTTGPAPSVNSAAGSPAGDGEGPMGGAPIGGGSKAPGEGGTGQQGTPTNNAPQSSTKPAC
jgi:hypothetical protein